MQDYFSVPIKNDSIDIGYNQPSHFEYRCYKNNLQLNLCSHIIEQFKKKYNTKNSELLIVMDLISYDALCFEEQCTPKKIFGVSIVHWNTVSGPTIIFKNPEREFKRLRLEHEKLNIANRNSDKFKVDIDY